MYIKLCDRCGRKTDNQPAFLVPVAKESNNATTQVNGQWFGKPITLCNNCISDFENFRLTHERFNGRLVEEDNFEGKEKYQIKF